MINIALPKGRLGEKVYNIFESLGYGCKEILENNRKLIFEDEKNGVRYFWVKPSDVAIYVEKGAADVGVVGKDILLEYNPDIYELLDLNIGKCRMCVAAKNGFRDSREKTLRVATKVSNIAKKYYNSIGREIEIIKLNGSIELAPILNMSDVIVDIVETGTTLKENDLSVVTEIVDISARFISNKSSYKFKNNEISLMQEKIRSVIK
jgi:ATP phosphoribosyltransferase